MIECNVETCRTRHHARGLCKVHYARFKRSGSVNTRSGSPPILMDVVIYVLRNYGSNCIYWPFALTSKGYGQIMRAGKCWRVHRLMLTLFAGEPANDELQAAHKCGVATCFNPSHLYWATRQQNEHDKIRHRNEKSPIMMNGAFPRTR